MNESAAPAEAERKGENQPGNNQTSAPSFQGLRASHAEIKRGRGRPKKSLVPEVVPPTPEQINLFNAKVGYAFRALFNLLALKSDCTCWLLDPEEEKVLGSAFGDVSRDFGLISNTVLDCIFASGAMLAISVSKLVVYQAYRKQQAELAKPKAEGLKKEAESVKAEVPPYWPKPPVPAAP